MTSSPRVRSSTRGSTFSAVLVLALLVIGGVVAFVMLSDPAPDVKPSPPTKATTAEPVAGAEKVKSTPEDVPARVKKNTREGKRAEKPIGFTVKCLGPGGATEPLANLEVFAAPALANGVDLDEQVSVRTGADGVATFSELPYTIYEVWAAPAGFIPLRLRGAKDGKKLDFLFRPGTTLTGTVTDAETGSPIANAFLQLHSDFGMAATTKRIQMALQQGVDPRDIQGYELLENPHPFFRATVETDSAGAYSLPAIPFDTDVMLSSEHDRYDTFEEVIKVKGSGPIVRDLRLFPRVDIVGRVVADETGEPIPGVKVQAAENGIPISVMGLFGKDGGVIVESVTDANGNYRLAKLPRGPQSVACNYPGYEDYVGAFEIKSIEKEFTHEIRLKRSASLMGTVVDNASQPLEGVSIYWATTESQLMSNKGLPPKPHAKTGPDGTFVLRGVPVGRTFNVLARHADFVNAEKDHFVLQPGEEYTGVEIMMSHGGAITGEALDALRQPIAGAAVIATPVKPPGAPLPPVITAADGSFVINNTQPATFEITCDSPGYCRGTVANVRDVATGVQFVLVKEAIYAGRFLTSDSQPLSKFKVRCKPSNADNAAIRIEQFRDKEGKFELKGLAPGLWDFEFTAEGVTPLLVERVAMREAERIENQELKVAEGGKIGGMVRSLSGKPVQAALIRLDFLESFAAGDKTFTTLQGSSNSNGEYEIKNLLPGRYLVWASHPSFAPMKEREIVIDLGPRQEVDFSLAKPASLRVVVRDPEGNTVPQASVWLFQGDSPMDGVEKITQNGMVGIKMKSDDGERTGIMTAQQQMQGGMKVTVGETGEISFSRKEPGDWTMWIQASGFYKYVAKLKLESGKEAIHEAELTAIVPGQKLRDAIDDRGKEKAAHGNRQGGGKSEDMEHSGAFLNLTNEQREALIKQKEGEELSAEEMALVKSARKALQKGDKGEPSEEEAPATTKEEKIKKRKQKADVDGDGKLSPEEREAMKAKRADSPEGEGHKGKGKSKGEGRKGKAKEGAEGGDGTTDEGGGGR